MRIVTGIIAALCIATSLDAQRPIPAEQWQSFVRTFTAYADSDRVVGASVAFVRDGKVIAHHEHGFANKAAREPISERSIYHWGSITKTLTAIAIMQLRERGKLRLDDPVVRYVPELRRVHNPYGAIDSVTIGMLLSHSGGFQGGTWPYGGQSWQPFEPTEWTQLVAMMPYQRVLFKPGARFSYSNPGYVYLGRVIEQLTGDPWESYIQKNVFAPLGLSSSYFGATPYYLSADRPNNYYARKDSASGRDTLIDNGKDFNPGITIPNGGWNAPVGDLAKYVAFLGAAASSDGALNPRHEIVLPRRALAEMWTAMHPTSAQAAASEWIGLSYFVLRRGESTFIGHTGSQAGYTSFFYVNRKTGDGVVVAFNTIRSSGTGASRPAFGMIRDRALELIR